jgi:hypothetical protein
VAGWNLPGFMMHSLNGSVRIIVTSDPRFQARYFFHIEPASLWQTLGGAELTLPRTYLGFGVHVDEMVWAAMCPYWFLILLSLVIAFAASPWKYSLRTLLIAITLLALLFGFIYWVRM